MHLAESTWPDVAGTETTVAVLPVGSTEQHGPHAPLSTDTLTAEAIATAGAQATAQDVVIAPTLPYGIAAEHRHFAGTLWLSPDTFRRTVGELLESLAQHGFECLILVNGHGGNADALREIAADLTRKDVATVAAFTWFDALDLEDMGHAGPVETAVVMHRYPELVRTDRFDDAREGGSETWGRWVSGTNIAYDSDEFTENGVIGDPTSASAERGEEITNAAGDALAELIESITEEQ